MSTTLEQLDAAYKQIIQNASRQLAGAPAVEQPHDEFLDDLLGAKADAAALVGPATPGIPQPDEHGEFPTPLDGALWMAITWAIPQTPLRGKAPFLPEWQKRASTDPEQISRWYEEFDCNFGSVALPGGVFIFEVDSPDVLKRYSNFTSGLVIQSGPGRGHRYYKQVPGVENIGQNATIHNDFSLRVDNEQCVSPGSVHPERKTQYRVKVSTGLVEPTSAEIAFWNSERQQRTPATVTGPKIPYGSHDTELTRIGGKLRQDGLEENAIADALIEVCEKRCEGYGNDYQEMCRKIAHSVCRYAIRDDRVLNAGRPVEVLALADASAVPEEIDQSEAAAIQSFDSSVVNGIYGDFVNLVTRGTTLAPQFAYAIAKTIVGARMAGRVKFENLDVEPRYYTALIGETGSGKGEAWRRTQQILTVEGLVGGCGIKIINSADSGAGIKDTFFEPPEGHPVLCYVDEVAGLGNKAAETRNPAILDTIIELADSTSISRVLAKKTRKAGVRTRNDARFCMVTCGQSGDVYMKAFAGRTQLGLWDRLTPEFGVPVEAGDLPPIDVTAAQKLMTKFLSLDYSGTMTMKPEATAQLNDFWKDQPVEVRKKARWKKNLMLDAFMSAFGRGSKVVESEDVTIAIKIFSRQLVIRRVCFTTEVPDRVGYYLGLIKRITEQMERRLAAGVPAEKVAKSRRDYETATNAYRDNEEHIFSKAWETHCRVHLRPVTVRKTNGQEYQKFLPAEHD